jgi:hypothetical protein
MPTSITSAGIIFDDTTTQTTSALVANAIGTAQLAAASVTPAKLSQPLTLATSVATTSGTSIDFTGIPAWVKRITVMFDGVSTNGTSQLLLRIGTSSGVVTTGYVGGGQQIASAPSFSVSGAGFLAYQAVSAANTHTGLFIIQNITSNTWVFSGSVSRQDGAMGVSAGSLALSDTLDRIRITASAFGTAAFDAGSVNIIYEG